MGRSFQKRRRNQRLVLVGFVWGSSNYGSSGDIKNIGENMTKGMFKRRRPVQEKLTGIREIVLRDSLSREKSVIELAKIYGVHPGSLLKYYKKNGIKKKRKNVECKSGYKRFSFKRKIEDLRGYIKENNITKAEIKSAILSIKEVKDEKKT